MEEAYTHHFEFYGITSFDLVKLKGGGYILRNFKAPEAIRRLMKKRVDELEKELMEESG